MRHLPQSSLVVQYFVFVSISIFFQGTCAVGDDVAIPKPAPFHNLIPRFKMPPGNLLRYKIPQWEVLYFLKYGIVPFIFYDPHFNRTNFISQVHKFRMYFDDGRPNRTTQQTLKDDESFREFLRQHGYPNYNQLPAGALNLNNKAMEEINGMLQAADADQDTEKSPEADENAKTDPETTLPPSLEVMMMDEFIPNAERISTSDEVKVGKRSDPNRDSLKKSRQNFWNTFLTRYPLSWKFTRSVMGNRNLLTSHTSDWMPQNYPYSTFGRNTKSFNVGIRNVNMDQGNGESDRPVGPSETRKSGKNFQTQGW